MPALPCSSSPSSRRQGNCCGLGSRLSLIRSSSSVRYSNWRPQNVQTGCCSVPLSSTGLPRLEQTVQNLSRRQHLGPRAAPCPAQLDHSPLHLRAALELRLLGSRLVSMLHHTGCQPVHILAGETPASTSAAQRQSVRAMRLPGLCWASQVEQPSTRSGIASAVIPWPVACTRLPTTTMLTMGLLSQGFDRPTAVLY